MAARMNRVTSRVDVIPGVLELMDARVSEDLAPLATLPAEAARGACAFAVSDMRAKHSNAEYATLSGGWWLVGARAQGVRVAEPTL